MRNFLLLLLTIFSFTVFSQIELVKDIREGSDNASPRNLFIFNGELYFSAISGELGSELWKTEGTGEGTVLVKEINPDGNAAPGFFFIYKDELFFSANDGSGSDLFKTNGTSEGTIKVPVGTSVFNPGLINDTLYFVNTTGGNRLMYFNGTSIDTVPNKGNSTEQAIGGLFAPQGDDILIYMGKDFEEEMIGRQLYKYNPKVDSFQFVKDFTEDNSNANLQYMTNMGDKTYFTADFGKQLWMSDGTGSGTKQINLPEGMKGMREFFAWNDQLFFEGDDGSNDQLWKYVPGTMPDLMQVKDIQDGSSSSSPRNLFTYKDKLYFSASSGDFGSELWVSDGSEEGTKMVKDINADGNSAPGFFFVLNDVLYFSANAGGGSDLWKTDGTEEGTVSVPVGTMIFNPVLNNDTLYFVQTTDGNTLKYFDGTSVSPVPNSGVGVESIVGGVYSPIGNDLLLYMGIGYEEDSIGRQLYKYDTQVDSFMLIKNFTEDDGNAGISNMTRIGDKVYFEVLNQLWVSDGTEEGTKEITSAMGVGGLNNFKEWNGSLYFEGDSGSSDQLFKYDTALDTLIMMSDLAFLNSANKNFDPSDFAIYGNYMYFRAEDQYDTKGHLWRTDGTSIEQLNTNIIDVDDISVLNGKLFFEGDNGETGNELYMFDAENLVPEKITNLSNLAAFRGDNANHDPSDYCIAGDYLYYRAEDEFDTKGHLWRTDGNKVEQLNSDIIDIDDIVLLNGKLYMEGDDGETGNELFVFDLEAFVEGELVMLSDLKALDGANANHDPSDFCPYGDYLYYRGEDQFDTKGHIWRTDGNSIEQMDDQIIDVDELTVYNEKIYFEGDDGVVGNELFVYDPNYNSIKRVMASENGLLVYPNPSRDYIIVLGTDAATFSIYSVNGKTIKSGTLLNNRINHNLKQGVYFLEIKDNKTTSISKIIVE